MPDETALDRPKSNVAPVTAARSTSAPPKIDDASHRSALCSGNAACRAELTCRMIGIAAAGAASSSRPARPSIECASARASAARRTTDSSLSEACRGGGGGRSGGAAGAAGAAAGLSGRAVLPAVALARPAAPSSSRLRRDSGRSSMDSPAHASTSRPRAYSSLGRIALVRAILPASGRRRPHRQAAYVSAATGPVAGYVYEAAVSEPPVAADTGAGVTRCWGGARRGGIARGRPAARRATEGGVRGGGLARPRPRRVAVDRHIGPSHEAEGWRGRGPGEAGAIQDFFPFGKNELTPQLRCGAAASGV